MVVLTKIVAPLGYVRDSIAAFDIFLIDFSNLSKQVSVLQLLLSIEDEFKLVEWNCSAFIIIVLKHYCIEFFLGNLMSEFCHGLYDIIRSDFSTVICVKYLEDLSDFFIGQQLFDINGGHEKFWIVDLLVAKVVDVFDDVLNLFLGQLKTDAFDNIN